MKETTSITAAAPFRAVLTPHRSLSPTGFLILMIAIGVVGFCVGLAFLLMGAWPVMGFLGLDVALIYWAFRQNYRTGNEFEAIEVTPEAVTLTRHAPDGKTSRSDFNTYWVRVALDERPDGRTALRLVSHGKSLMIGAFLTDEERREFAGVLAGELVAASSKTGF
jgi:uncharacterized membrane protein